MKSKNETMKDLLKAYRETKEAEEKADAAYEADFENDELGDIWHEAWGAFMNAYTALANGINAFTNGDITYREAMKLIVEDFDRVAAMIDALD